MVRVIRVSFVMVFVQVMVFVGIRMVLYIKVLGILINRMVKVFYFCLMVMFTRVFL